MKFFYLKTSAQSNHAFPNQTYLLKPYISVKIINNDKHIQCYGLVDSGADYSFIPEDIAKKIGLENIANNKEVKIRGVGGIVTAYFHNLEIEIGGWKYQFYCGVIPSKNGNGYPKLPVLLGQIGFFDLFKEVKFNKLECIIELKQKS